MRSVVEAEAEIAGDESEMREWMEEVCKRPAASSVV